MQNYITQQHWIATYHVKQWNKIINDASKYFCCISEIILICKA